MSELAFDAAVLFAFIVIFKMIIKSVAFAARSIAGR